MHRWVLPALLGLAGCSAPAPRELDPERVLADQPLQRPDGTPLAAFPTSIFGLALGRSEFQLSGDCEAAGGRLPASLETAYGPPPEPSPWTCLDLPASGLGSGRFRRAGARFCDHRSCELVFAGVPMSSAMALGPLIAKYGPPIERDPRTPCPQQYGYDIVHEQSTVAWTWRDAGKVRATIVLTETCAEATLTYTEVARTHATLR